MSYSSSYPSRELLILRTFASNHLPKNNQTLTRPNYICKCCKQTVFFFQASNGGKVLFDSLGQPWPIHDCLGIQYKRRKAKLTISSEEWTQLFNLNIVPMSDLNRSLFQGLLYEAGDHQFDISVSLLIDDVIMVRDIYLNKSHYCQLSEEIETLIIFDDGRHFLSTSRLVDKKLFKFQDFYSQKPFKEQPKLI